MTDNYRELKIAVWRFIKAAHTNQWANVLCDDRFSALERTVERTLTDEDVLIYNDQKTMGEN